VRSILLLSALLCLVAAPAAAQNGRLLPLNAECVLLLDPEGKVLFAKNPEEVHAPASLVKLMTLYLAYEELEAGRAQWDDPVAITRNAALTPRFRMGLRAGEAVPLSVLLEALAIASANDAATAVAEHLAGSEEDFVVRMNAKAQELGLKATRFANAHGLPDPLQRSTAYDLATLTARLLHDHPAARLILGGKTFLYRGRIYTRRIPLFDHPGGVEALKTGFTNEAGYNLAVAAWRAGQQFVLIVLGAHTRFRSFRDARTLLEYGFHEAGFASSEEPALALPSRRPGPTRRSRAAVGKAG
jgi:D-alanyl-D-alanine carboxypeptidase